VVTAIGPVAAIDLDSNAIGTSHFKILFMWAPFLLIYYLWMSSMII